MFFLIYRMIPYAPGYVHPIPHPHHASHPMPRPHLRYPTTTYMDPPTSRNYNPYQRISQPYSNQYPNTFFYDHPTGRFYYKNDSHKYDHHHNEYNQHEQHQQTSSSSNASKSDEKGKKSNKSTNSTSSVIITEVTSDEDELVNSLNGEDKEGMTGKMRKASIKKDYVDAVSISEEDDVDSSKTKAIEKL
jgi:hypothetical protein